MMEIFVVSGLIIENLNNSMEYFYDILETIGGEGWLNRSERCIADKDRDYFFFMPSSDREMVVNMLQGPAYPTIEFSKFITSDKIIMIDVNTFNDVILLAEKEINASNTIDLNILKHMVTNASKKGE